MAKPQRDILDSDLFKRVMYFKFCMMMIIWGLVPLLLPPTLFPLLGLNLSSSQVVWARIWGTIVLLDTFLYIYIYGHPHKTISKYFLMFAIFDNAGLALVLLSKLFITGLPWGIAINIPFQLFFGYFFLRFVREGNFIPY